MRDKTRILAEIEPDQILTVETKKRNKFIVPSYHCIGGNMEFKTRVKGFDDLYSIFQELSKPATWFWWELLKNRNRDSNTSVFTAENNIIAKKVTKAYKELHRYDLIKRVANKLYMINPKAYLPEFSKYEEVYNKWRRLP